MADKLPYASGDDPAIVEANRKYQEAQRLLSESLDSRKNRFFDPTLLAMAQGFLTPGQTGSFGESLGNVAKNVGAVQEQETKLDQDLAQRRLGLAGQGVEMAKLQSNDAATRQFIERLKGGEPTQQAAPTAPQAAPQIGGLPTLAAPPNAPATPPVTGPLSTPVVTPVREPAPPPAPIPTPTPAPVPAPIPVPPPAPVPAPAAPQGGLSPQNLRGVPVLPPNPTAYPSMLEFLQLNQGKGLPVADLVKDYQTKIAPNINMKVDGGLLNQRTGEIIPSVSAKTIPMEIFGYKGTHNVTENDAMMLRQFERENNQKAYNELAANILNVNASNVGADGKPLVPKSIEEKERINEREKAISAADTAEEVESRKDFAAKNRSARDILATANQMRAFAEDKEDFKKMTGILSNNKISSAVAMLVREGIGGKGFSVGIPAIEDVLRNLTLNDQQQAKYRLFLQTSVQMQLDAEATMKGATSNNERNILGNARISPQDTAEAVLMKADLLTTQAQFNKRAYREFKASEMTAEKFLDSPKFERMHLDHMKELAKLSVGLTRLAAPTAAKPAAAKPAKGGKDLDSAKQRLEELTK
jgi:hypothetical protein